MKGKEGDDDDIAAGPLLGWRLYLYPSRAMESH